MADGQYKRSSEEKKDQKREEMQEIGSRMCLKRTGKNYEKEAKIKIAVCSKKNYNKKQSKKQNR